MKSLLKKHSWRAAVQLTYSLYCLQYDHDHKAVSDSKYILLQEKSIILKKPVWSTSILSATTVLQFKTGSLKLQANCY